ncbi:MAG: vanadium-dependent haloperoxidase [Candidatus Kapabacteria bacterium]|nr:vanadium-dependent haloperoxidase [Candidatus Kapabacteria bacterium]
MKHLLSSLLVVLALAAGSLRAGVPDSADIVHQWNRAVIEVIMEDGFGPPIAARIHAYTNLAAYEAGRHATPGYKTLVGQLNGFKDCPLPDASKTYDWRVAVVAAFQQASSKLLYRIYITDSLAKVHFGALEKVVDKDVFDRSKAFGIAVGKAINAYAKSDGYARTQGLPDWEWPKCDSCWEPTPPNFAKPLSPYCGRVRTIALKSVDQFALEAPILFSKNRSSDFFKAAMEVYNISKNMTADQKEIANFWNDNPVLTNYRGHFVYNSRQISPGGHWLNIARQIMVEDKVSMVKALEISSMVSFALFDGFTACWDQKFKHNLIRPVTYINNLIDKKWEPLLQTPPFPEHASGHSTITAAAAEVLQHHFGDRPFSDSTEVLFGWPVRRFANFRAAADEASISRVYGGIHYRRGCDAGNEHGKKIGKYVVATVRYRD